MDRVLTEAEKAAIQQIILPVIATGTDGSSRPVGTCWIFAIAGRDALAFSATHIFDEVVRSEGRHDPTAPNMPDILRPPPKPVALAATRLKAIYRESIDRLVFVNIERVHRDPLFDVAVLELTFQSDAPLNSVFERRMAIHTGPVIRDSKVCAIGYAGMERTIANVDEIAGTSHAVFYNRLTFARGQCIEAFGVRGPRGLPQGPCFEIDAHTQHGMSGGPIWHQGYGDELVACGVISRGTSFGGQETTMASCLWPAYSLSIPIQDENNASLTLIGLARDKYIDDRSDGPNHFVTVVPGAVVSWI